MASSTYYIRIIKARYNRRDVTLYIEVIPTGAGCGFGFPYEEELKLFFLRALCKVYTFDLLPKKKVLDLELPFHQSAKPSDFVSQTKTDYLHGPLEYTPLKDLDIEMYNLIESHTTKYIKQVTPYDNSLDKLMTLLKTTTFKQEEHENLDGDNKSCLHCGKSFKSINRMPIEKLIARAKQCTVKYNDEGKSIYDIGLIKNYLKNKVGVSMTSKDIQSIINSTNNGDGDGDNHNNNGYNSYNSNDDINYTWSQQCTDRLYFDSPQDNIYYCCSIRFCSTLCASEDLKKKSWKEVFDSYDIYGTYAANYYKVELYKKNVDKDAIKNLINKAFSTVAY
ncbi:unnamed protein product [Cunninghamella blakesleeana]